MMCIARMANTSRDSIKFAVLFWWVPVNAWWIYYGLVISLGTGLSIESAFDSPRTKCLHGQTLTDTLNQFHFVFSFFSFVRLLPTFNVRSLATSNFRSVAVLWNAFRAMIGKNENILPRRQRAGQRQCQENALCWRRQLQSAEGNKRVIFQSQSIFVCVFFCAPATLLGKTLNRSEWWR